jgi:hypothetical protein
MVALARNLDFAGSGFLTGLTAVFLPRLRQAPAWKMCTLSLLSCRHRDSPFQIPKLDDCSVRPLRHFFCFDCRWHLHQLLEQRAIVNHRRS